MLRPISMAIFVLLAACSMVNAGPKSDSPYTLLAWSKAAHTEELYNTLVAGYEKELQTVMQHSEKPTRLQTLAQTQARILILRRQSRVLQQMGEPGGFDARLRLRDLMDQTFKLISNAQQTAAGQKFLEQINRSAAQFNSQMAKVEELVQKDLANNDWEMAENRLHAFLDKTQPIMAALGSQFFQRYKPIEDELNRVVQLREQAARTAANEGFATARDEVKPDLRAILSSIDTAAQQVGATGSGTIGEESYTGPELIAYAEQQWVEGARGTLMARAYEWARLSAIQQSESAELTQLETDYASFTQAIQSAIVKIINVDATRVPADGVADLYNAYTPVCARVTSRVDTALFDESVDKALINLASKSPTVASDVKACRDSTEELLRWKARVAEQKSKTLQQGFTSLTNAFVAALQKQQDFDGILNGQRSTTYAHLAMSSNLIMYQSTTAMTDSKVHAGPFDGSASGSAAIANYHDRTWSVVIHSNKIAEAAQAFKDELALGDSHLSLRAAQAIALTDQRDWESVGGPVTKLSLESIVTQFATLSKNAGYFVQLGKLPKEELQGQPSTQLILRADIDPTWLQHRYYVVELPSAP